MAVWRTTGTGEPLRAFPDDACGPGHNQHETAHRLRQWGERKELDKILTLFATDAVFFTPLTDNFCFTGRDEIRTLLGSVFQAVDPIRFHTDFGDGELRVLVYRGVVAGRTFDESLLLRFNDRHEVVEAVASVRPLSGLLKLSAAVGPLLIRDNDRIAAAAGSGAFLRFLARVWSFADRTLVPLASPRKAR